MSCYLNIYLVPQGGKPLCLTCYSKSSDVYDLIDDVISVPYAYSGDDDNEEHFVNLTRETMDCIIQATRSTRDKWQKRLDVLYKMLRTKYSTELKKDIMDTEETIADIDDAFLELRAIRIIVDACGEYEEFEKVLINQG